MHDILDYKDGAYLVAWKGSTETTWEPPSSLIYCSPTVIAFHNHNAHSIPDPDLRRMALKFAASPEMVTKQDVVVVDDEDPDVQANTTRTWQDQQMLVDAGHAQLVHLNHELTDNMNLATLMDELKRSLIRLECVALTRNTFTCSSFYLRLQHIMKPGEPMNASDIGLFFNAIRRETTSKGVLLLDPAQFYQLAAGTMPRGPLHAMRDTMPLGTRIFMACCHGADTASDLGHWTLMELALPTVAKDPIVVRVWDSLGGKPSKSHRDAITTLARWMRENSITRVGTLTAKGLIRANEVARQSKGTLDCGWWMLAYCLARVHGEELKFNKEVVTAMRGRMVYDVLRQHAPPLPVDQISMVLDGVLFCKVQLLLLYLLLLLLMLLLCRLFNCVASKTHRTILLFATCTVYLQRLFSIADTCLHILTVFLLLQTIF